MCQVAGAFIHVVSEDLSAQHRSTRRFCDCQAESGQGSWLSRLVAVNAGTCGDIQDVVDTGAASKAL